MEEKKKRQKRQVGKKTKKKKQLPTVADGYKAKRPQGRPSKMTANTLAYIKMICITQANPTNVTIYETLKVSEACFYRWLDEYDGFKEEIAQYKQLGLTMLRKKGFLMAHAGDPAMLKLMLTKRDPEYKKASSGPAEDEIEDGDADMPDCTFL